MDDNQNITCPTTFQLHGLSPMVEEDAVLIESILKTYNSMSRCAYKRFKKMGLRAMLKSHRTPLKRKSRFRDVPFVNGRPMEYECPTGMSDKMWLQMRRESYLKKAASASPFWQIDKDLGSPVAGAESAIGEWARARGYEFDSTTLHNAVLNGLKCHMSFERQKSKWLTSKENPAFGDNVERSRRRMDKEQYQLTRNGSMTLIGRKGSSKFHFDLDKDLLTFTWRRRRIPISFKSHRFSKRGWKRFSTLIGHMEKGEIPVTFTLTMTEKSKFNLSLTYDQSKLDELEKVKDNAKVEGRTAVVYPVGRDIICHQVMQAGRILHSQLHHLDNLNGRNRNIPQIEELEQKRRYGQLTRLKRGLRNRAISSMEALMKKIFRVNRSYAVEKVVVETPASRRRGAFNRNFLGFSEYDIKNDSGQQGPISMTRLNALVKGQCAKMGMEFRQVDGTFVQAYAISKSHSMPEAIRTAASALAALSRCSKGKFNPHLTFWSDLVQDPSMLDWVKHLLHNGRSRQASRELKRVVQNGMVEKAIRLIDTRSRCSE